VVEMYSCSPPPRFGSLFHDCGAALLFAHWRASRSRRWRMTLRTWTVVSNSRSPSPSNSAASQIFRAVSAAASCERPAGVSKACRIRLSWWFDARSCGLVSELVRELATDAQSTAEIGDRQAVG
jgi:hypothetical protein